MSATAAKGGFPYPHRTIAEVWSARGSRFNTLRYVAKNRRVGAWQRMRFEELAKEWKGD